MTEPHLDDEQLSLLLDGHEVSGRAHVEDEGCEACADRLAALRRARDAVAAAPVAPLPTDVLDRLVGTALATPAVAEVVPITSSRRRGVMTPPPAWLVGAAAGIAALVGVAGLLRAADVGRDGDDAGSLATMANDESAELDADVASGTAGVAADSSAVAGPIDPEVVTSDLADQDDPSALAQVLRDRLGLLETTSAFAARGAAPSAAAVGDDAARESSSGGASGAPPVATTSAPIDRAQCRAQAEELGAGRFAALLSTATLRWQGEPAEVLVFRLSEPSTDGTITRQALVLSRPGCALLADPRF